MDEPIQAGKEKPAGAGLVGHCQVERFGPQFWVEPMALFTPNVGAFRDDDSGANREN